MGKLVKAVRPYIYEHNSNFKQPLYEEWLKAGGKGIENRQWKGKIESLLHHINLPTLFAGRTEARLCMVEAASLQFDAFPDYLCHEVIPVFWDCWPGYWYKVEQWFRKHYVRSAIFTSSQTAEHFRGCFPEMNILTITEGIETDLYQSGCSLKEREFDFLEFGRCCNVVDSSLFSNSIVSLNTWKNRKILTGRENFIKVLANTKVTLSLTRQDTQPLSAQGIDTLTQRYWECMLSRIVMVGRAPSELIDLIGYDPVIPLDKNNPLVQIEDMITHIEDYQELVDKNRETALRLGDWNVRMKQVMVWLRKQGYDI